MNGALPRRPDVLPPLSQPSQIVQVMSDAEIEDRKQAEQRLPRQASHYAQLVGHFLTVKNSSQIARAMDAHFDRLKKYHFNLLGRADMSADDREE